MSSIDTANRIGPGGQPDGDRGAAAPAVQHPVDYFRVFYILLGLTALTVIASFIHIKSELFNVLVALMIATIKATFVCRFFMHLKFEGKLIYTVLIVPISLAAVLTIALIPDIALGRHTAFNDIVGMYEGLVGGSGK